MKKIALTLLLLSGTVFGHGSKVSLTGKATASALETFELSATGSDIRAFEGVKAWPTQDGIRVKIYVGGVEVKYLCEEGHDSDGAVIFNCTED